MIILQSEKKCTKSCMFFKDVAVHYLRTLNYQ